MCRLSSAPFAIGRALLLTLEDIIIEQLDAKSNHNIAHRRRSRVALPVKTYVGARQITESGWMSVCLFGWLVS